MSVLPDERSTSVDETIILAFGSNLAGEYCSTTELLEAALCALPDAGMTVVRRSGWWRSAAWPDPAAPPYLNGVAIVETTLTPRGVLEACRALEQRFGRRRGAPNAPRTLDIDVIAYGRQLIDEPGLIVPHPRAHQRAFVMGPLTEIAPQWRHPVLKRTAAQLFRRADVGRDARSSSA